MERHEVGKRCGEVWIGISCAAGIEKGVVGLGRGMSGIEHLAPPVDGVETPPGGNSLFPWARRPSLCLPQTLLHVGRGRPESSGASHDGNRWHDCARQAPCGLSKDRVVGVHDGDDDVVEAAPGAHQGVFQMEKLVAEPGAFVAGRVRSRASRPSPSTSRPWAPLPPAEPSPGGSRGFGGGPAATFARYDVIRKFS